MSAQLCLVFLFLSMQLSLVAIEIIVVALLDRVSNDLSWRTIEVIATCAHWVFRMFFSLLLIIWTILRHSNNSLWLSNSSNLSIELITKTVLLQLVWLCDLSEWLFLLITNWAYRFTCCGFLVTWAWWRFFILVLLHNLRYLLQH